MKILLVNPPSEFLIDDNVFPSLGLLYLSAYLKTHGYDDIEVLDLNGNRPLPQRIDKDIIGFYSNTPQFPATVALLGRIRQINENQKAVYVIGGPHVSGKPEDALHDFDAIVAGEGERAIVEIAKRYEDRHTFNHDIIRLDYIKDIDEIPFPDRNVIDLESYRYLIDGQLTTTLISSRGCPYMCAFCANNAWGKTLRMRSPRNVVAELKHLKERYGYRSFMFFDDTMTVDKKRMAVLCDMIGGLDIHYRCFVRSDTVNKKLLSIMKETGCAEVGVGMESGSQRILDTVNKGESVDDNMKVVEWCHDLGIRVKGFFVIGFPGEDKESIQETVRFIEEADLDDFDITIYTPYPGSRIYREKEKYDIQFEDHYKDAWYKGKPGFYRTSVSTSALRPEDLVRLRDEIESRYKKKGFFRREMKKDAAPSASKESAQSL